MKKKHKVLVVILILAALISGTFLGGYFYQLKTGEKGSGIVLDEDASETEVGNDDSASIQFPVYPDITISADQMHIPIVLANPSDNVCYFQFMVSVDGGDAFYTSDWVLPGRQINGVDMQQKLEKGKHTLLIRIATRELETEKMMNGGNIPVTLHVN